MVILGGWVFLVSEVPLHTMWQEDTDVLAMIYVQGYRGTSLIRKRAPLGSCSRAAPRALWRS